MCLGLINKTENKTELDRVKFEIATNIPVVSEMRLRLQKLIDYLNNLFILHL